MREPLSVRRNRRLVRRRRHGRDDRQVILLIWLTVAVLLANLARHWPPNLIPFH
jgi:hypothetical protein